jgi:dTDP-L-rhamnose 4-epimerase
VFLGFEPRVACDEDIAEFSKWALGQDVAEDTYDRSIREMQDKGLFTPRP